MRIINKKLLTLLAIFLLIVSILLTVYLVKQRQELRGRAQEAPLAFTLNPNHPRLLVDAAEVEQIKEKIRTQTWARNNFASIKRAAEARLAIPVNIPGAAGYWGYYLCPPDFTKPIDNSRSDPPNRYCCPDPQTNECTYWPGGTEVKPRPATCPGPSPVPPENRKNVTLEETWRTGVHRGYLKDLLNLALTYQFYDASPAAHPKEAYAQKAREILLGYAAIYPTLGLHDRVGCWNENSSIPAAKVFTETISDALYLLRNVAQVYDLLYNSQDSQGQDIFSTQDKLAIENFVRQVVETIRRYSYTNIGGNWQAWHNAATGLAGFLLNDQSLINEAIEGKSDGATVKSRGFKQQILEELGDDGFWPEGPGYHHTVLEAYLQLAEAARHAGVDLYNLDVDPNPSKVKNFRMMFEMVKKMVMPNGMLPRIEDGGGIAFIPSLGFYDLAYTRFGDGFYAWFINKNKSKRNSILSLLYGQETLPAGEYSPQSNVLKNVGYGVLRAGSGDNFSYTLLDFGPFGGHGHPDKLNFVYYNNNKILLPDLGSVAYGSPLYTRWFKQSLAHNTLVVDGQSQPRCVLGQPASPVCENPNATPVTGSLLFCNFDSDSPCRNDAQSPFKVIKAAGGTAYPNASAERILALNQDYLIDSLEVNSTNNQSHTFDLPFHSNIGGNDSSSLITSVGLTPSTLGYTKNGYQYLEATKSAVLTGPFWAKWIQPVGQATQEEISPEVFEEIEDQAIEGNNVLAAATSNLNLQVNGLNPTSTDQIFSVVGPYPPLGAKKPFLIWRKTGTNAKFISVIESFTEDQRKISNISLNGDIVTITFVNGRVDTFNLTTMTGSVTNPSPSPTPTPIPVKSTPTPTGLPPKPTPTPTNPPPPPPTGEYGDNVLDIRDYNTFVSCFRKQVAQVPGCEAADLNDDGVVDSSDFVLLFNSFQTQTGD